jgi:hypothetical protein
MLNWALVALGWQGSGGPKDVQRFAAVTLDAQRADQRVRLDFAEQPRTAATPNFRLRNHVKVPQNGAALEGMGAANKA